MQAQASDGVDDYTDEEPEGDAMLEYTQEQLQQLRDRWKGHGCGGIGRTKAAPKLEGS